MSDLVVDIGRDPETIVQGPGSQRESLQSIRDHMNQEGIFAKSGKAALRIFNWYRKKVEGAADMAVDAFLKEATPYQLQSVANDPSFDELVDTSPYRAGSTTTMERPAGPQVQARSRVAGLQPEERPQQLTVNSRGIPYYNYGDISLVRSDITRYNREDLYRIAKQNGYEFETAPGEDGWREEIEKSREWLIAAMDREANNYAGNK